MQRDGLELFFEYGGNIHNGIGLRGKIIADGRRGVRLRVPAAGNGGAPAHQKGVGCRAPCYSMVQVALVGQPGVRRENSVRPHLADDPGDLCRKAQHIVQRAVAEVQKVERLCTEVCSGGNGFGAAHTCGLLRGRRAVLIPLVAVGDGEVMHRAARLRQHRHGAAHADLVVVGMGLDAESTFAFQDIRRRKQRRDVKRGIFHKRPPLY